MPNARYYQLIRNGKVRFLVFLVIHEKDGVALQDRSNWEDHFDFRATEASKKCQARFPRNPSEQVKRDLGWVSHCRKSNAE